jgi:hypothetical protein
LEVLEVWKYCGLTYIGKCVKCGPLKLEQPSLPTEVEWREEPGWASFGNVLLVERMAEQNTRVVVAV